MSSAATILFLRNVPFDTTIEDLRQLCERYGPLRQIRLGNAAGTKGTAYVVFQRPADAKQACMKLSGYAIRGRYLIVGFHQARRVVKGTASATT